jgi:hypothetical protein
LQKSAEKDEAFVTGGIAETRDQIVHARPKETGFRRLGEAIDADARLLRERSSE